MKAKTKKPTRKSKAKRKPKRKLLKRTKLQLLYDQLNNLKPLMAEILTKDKLSRDDDNLLAIEVWKMQGMKDGDTFKNFKYKLIRNKITTPESIGRTRRVLQDKYWELQGKIYRHRHGIKKVPENQLSLF